MAYLPAFEPHERLVLAFRPRDLDDRDRRFAPAGWRGFGAGPLRRQARVRVAGRDRRGSIGRHLGRRTAGFPATRRVLRRLPTRTRRLDARRLPGLLRVVRRPRCVALPLCLVPVAQLQQRVERADRRLDTRSRVADRGKARRYRVDREGLGLDGRHLVPGQWGGDPRVRQRPHGIGGRHGAVLGVLVVVEEDPVPLLLPPLGRGEIRHTPLHVPREGERRPADLRERPARLDPDVDVDAARSGRLGPADEPDGLQRLADDERDLADLRPRHARDRVQVHPQFVGVVHVLGPDRVWVEVDAAEVRDPGKPRRVIDDDLVGRPAGREGQGRRPDPVGSVVRGSLLEERLPSGAVHEPLERHGSATGAAQCTVRHGEVVLDEVQLGAARLREIDLPRVRDRDLAAVDPEDLLLRRHGDTIPSRQPVTTGR